MWSGLVNEVREQAAVFRRMVTSREFWVYTAVVALLLLVTLACVHIALSFDTLTRGKLALTTVCDTSEGKLGVIIVGAFVFGIASLFTLGEVTQWVEHWRESRAPGRRLVLSISRPIAYIAGTVTLGVGGYVLMSAWCY